MNADTEKHVKLELIENLMKFRITPQPFQRILMKNEVKNITKSWRDNWVNLSTYFKYSETVRCLIHTINTIDGFNRQLRKVTKSKTVSPSDDSLLKILYLVTLDTAKKWTGHRQDRARFIPSLRYLLRNGFTLRNY